MTPSRAPIREAAPAVESTAPTKLAVKFPRFGRIVFLTGPIPEQVRSALAELGGEVIEGAWLDESENAQNGRDATETPALILAVSRDEPTKYRLFKTANELDQNRYEPTGMTHAGSYNAVQFATFVDALRTLDHIAGHTDESDTEALWDEVTRDLDRLGKSGVG